MSPRLLDFLTAVSLLLFMACVAMWVRIRSVPETLHLSQSFMPAPESVPDALVVG